MRLTIDENEIGTNYQFKSPQKDRRQRVFWYHIAQLCVQYGGFFSVHASSLSNKTWQPFS